MIVRFRQFLECHRFRLVSLFALGVLFSLPSEGIGVPLCLFLITTDVPCPMCGLTRSMSSFLHLELAKSFMFHPLGGFAVAFLCLSAVTNRSFATIFVKPLWQRFFNAKYLIVIVLLIWVARVFVLPWLAMPPG